MKTENTSFDFIDAIYCINLDRRPDRWAKVQKEFRKLGIVDRVVRLSAFDHPDNPRIGCILSHRKIIEIAQQKWLKNVLIFEDDINICRSRRAINKVVHALAKVVTFDLFYFWGLFDMKRAQIRKKWIHLGYVQGLWCGHAIVHSSSFYPVLLDAWPSSVKEVEKSEAYIRYWALDRWTIDQQSKYICLCSRKICVYQKHDDTDIQERLLNKIIENERARWSLVNYKIWMKLYWILRWIISKLFWKQI